MGKPTDAELVRRIARLTEERAAIWASGRHRDETSGRLTEIAAELEQIRRQQAALRAGADPATVARETYAADQPYGWKKHWSRS
jgi:hypothetical protein